MMMVDIQLSEELNCRGVIGSDVVIGDTRWAGAWGMKADFIAKTKCCILFVTANDVMVSLID